LRTSKQVFGNNPLERGTIKKNERKQRKYQNKIYGE
jgi:hypothetical protein